MGTLKTSKVVETRRGKNRLTDGPSMAIIVSMSALVGIRKASWASRGAVIVSRFVKKCSDLVPEGPYAAGTCSGAICPVRDVPRICRIPHFTRENLIPI
ncbi:hypothetical protein TcasGA2_TC032767 [Tribolium castaneum]|uniref:Uncharacterized protein n=1 Tax=Tribolium castaneum TaxID=7070 RepID=A0A139WIX7_TRICA|nr:hypothetical protein TcasGA2_TC032767 [Tribolium castaneum]